MTNGISRIQFPPTQKANWCFSLMIKNAIIKNRRHKLKLYIKKKKKKLMMNLSNEPKSERFFFFFF